MSDFDDAIGDMADDLLAEAGVSCVYSRGTSSASLTLRRSVQPSVLLDNGNGQIVEVQSIDFIGKTLILPFATPARGDRITTGGVVYEVQPSPGGDKVYRRISPQMTRIHTKQIGQ